jgi:hypothetical protein
MMLASRPWLATALLAATALVGACSDDNGSNPPDTPPTPANVQAPTVTETSVSLTWNAVTGADSYVVQREVAAPPAIGGAPANVVLVFETVGTPATNAFTDETVAPETTYNYRVATVIDGAQGQYSTPVQVTTGEAGPKVATLDADITTNRTLYADTTYTISGFVHVANGATLTIQPGTLILGDYEVVGSSLFVLRGAKIDAQGTALAPIVFTSERAAGQRQAGDWGGLILVGNGIINRANPVILEGSGTNAQNYEVNYAGGNDNADDSGTLRYVRVEFAGYGPAQDQELNGLTMAAVGSGTDLEYVQVLNGLDDSFEWFGGAVDGKYLVSYEAGDDHFDMSEGYVGRLQHLIAFQSKVVTPRAGAGNVSNDPQGIENDGCAGANCTNSQASEPLTQPLVANFTLVGAPAGTFAANSGGYGMVLRRGTAGYYVNGVVARFEKAAFSLRDTSTANRIANDQLVLSNVVTAETPAQFHAGQNGGTFDPGTYDLTASILSGAGNFELLPTNPANAGQFDWTPSATSEARVGGLSPFTGDVLAKAGAVVTATTYRGAVDPNGPKWFEGWLNYADN